MTSTRRCRCPGAEWGTRTETKNVNSLRSVERAVRSEMIRQAGVLDAGGRIIQETRHFHEDTGETTSGRSKEEATDYRYFPEPDLVPLAPDAAWVAELKAALPELPRDTPAAAAGGLGSDRLRDAVGRQRRRGRADRGDDRGRRHARRGPQVVARRAGPARQRERHRAGRRSASPRRTSPSCSSWSTTAS